jgi:hypothetical protein
MDLTLAPEGPWLPTAWGEAELADGRAIAP